MRWLPVVTALLLGSCGDTIYKDYPVVRDDGGTGLVATGPPAIVPGLYKEQLFSTLVDGGKVFIIQGFQGGTWVHLSVRVTGMPSSGTIRASLGPAVGAIEYPIRLVRSAEGFREAYDIPIPIRKTGAALQALYGLKTTLEVTFTSGGQRVTAKRSVTLAKG